ncbi:MAG: PHP domain-containing protein [Candidatus Moranbacteria bacterium]|jgi:putative hydrolase|nr:PHP domain-containing protein [Candidatus Moranbacteria bacterium]
MLKIDLHLHTVASGHAQCTLVEYIEQAKKLKMNVIGISDHGPNNAETLTTEVYFRTLDRIPDVVDGIRVLKGIEANVINEGGDIDVSDKLAERLDFVMASFHENAGYIDQGKEGNTKTLIKLIRSGKIDIITHPFNTKSYDVDMEKISEEACKNNVLLEVNFSYIKGRKLQSFTISNLKIIIDIVRRNGKKVILGSDAHNIWELGDDSSLTSIKEEIGLTDDLIINNYSEELFEFLGIKE